jgi:hypothetical protein
MYSKPTILLKFGVDYDGDTDIDRVISYAEILLNDSFRIK